MFSYEHSLLAILTITDHNRTTGVFNILHAEPCPANRVGMIEIILLFTISFVIAGIQQRVNRIFFTCYRCWSFDPIIIPVKDHRISIPSQQDKRVSTLLEPIIYPGFQGFVRLRIMIVNEGYSIGGMSLHQCVIKNFGQIIVSALQRS
ncbi:hypothetical protein D3C76_1098570 [compost metagenome]